MMWGGPMSTPARGGPYHQIPSHAHASKESCSYFSVVHSEP
jgi:hypothetical protein